MFNTQVKNNTVFKKLFDTALESDTVFKHRHAAAIVYKNKIIAIGKNQDKTHPVQMEYQADGHKIYLHAEIDAIVKARKSHGTEFLKNCDIYVLRLTKGGSVSNSKPCAGCQKAIDAFKFKGVFWT